jgi:hypothetical protein
MLAKYKELVGVRGWLWLLCVSLCITPFAYLFVVLRGKLPSTTMGIVIMVGLIAMGIYAFAAGYKLWTIKPGAVKFARIFLMVNIAVNFVLIVAVSLGNISAGAEAASGFIWPFIWLAYLRWSKRVAATYGQAPVIH